MILTRQIRSNSTSSSLYKFTQSICITMSTRQYVRIPPLGLQSHLERFALTIFIILLLGNILTLFWKTKEYHYKKEKTAQMLLIIILSIIWQGLLCNYFYFKGPVLNYWIAARIATGLMCWIIWIQINIYKIFVQFYSYLTADRLKICQLSFLSWHLLTTFFHFIRITNPIVSEIVAIISSGGIYAFVLSCFIVQNVITISLAIMLRNIYHTDSEATRHIDALNQFELTAKLLIVLGFSWITAAVWLIGCFEQDRQIGNLIEFIGLMFGGAQILSVIFTEETLKTYRNKQTVIVA
ncbi:hypothetical protein BC833DRAFT_590700 [Globomyces pollinis-pini]|nr:hypothetical protein BC833DRAFT_590700 [Globomyces pollinis-pini]